MLNPQSAIGNPKSRGFTLIEIVITIVVVSIISGIAAIIILQGARGYSDESRRSDVHYQARLAVERIAREARLIRSCVNINGPANPSNTLDFNDINGNNVIFSVAGGDLTRGVADLLASGITSAQPFSFLASDGTATTACPGIWFVQVDVTAAQDGETLQLRSRVHPRNF